MALDGIVISNIVHELNEKLTNGRISKIAQPENDELILTIKNNKEQYRLLISASASLPLVYLASENKQNPMTAPNYCMLLRKHLNGGRIVNITQPSLERIIRIEIEHLNELGDLCTKYLIIEIMGKHSNIIFVTPDDKIIDSIKHVSTSMSSVREVLPGRDYFIPDTTHKLNPLEVDEEVLINTVLSKPGKLSKVIYTSLTGISPAAAIEICHRASLDSDSDTTSLNDIERLHLAHTFIRTMEDIKAHNYTPNIVYKDKEPVEFSSLRLTHYSDLDIKEFDSISRVLEIYYAEKNSITRIRQKSVDLRKIVQNALERSRKKYDLQLRQLKDTQKRDKYKVYGELITTYGYNIEKGAKFLEALNYYDNEMVKIPLDDTISPIDNAKKYFDKYSKLKRTYEALISLTKETKEEIDHLESISTALDIALLEEDLVELKEELIEYGYMKRKFNGKKKVKITSKPFHYISSDGFHMYVGKNNFQNDELTFKYAIGNDWWFHAKGVPGSHVIVKTNGEELPDTTFEEAARLAAHYSKNKDNEKVEIDYTEKKNIKKTPGGKPGFVIYHTNYSMLISPSIDGIEKI